MTNFLNPLSRHRPNGFAARVAEIKTWTRETLSLDENAIVSVNELACSEPDCPPKQVVVLILGGAECARKLEVHKSLIETTREDISEAVSALEHLDNPA